MDSFLEVAFAQPVDFLYAITQTSKSDLHKRTGSAQKTVVVKLNARG
jgi:hypothetical protein